MSVGTDAINPLFLLRRLLPLDQFRATSPLAGIVGAYWRYLPLILILGLIGSALEGIGIGLLIPLVGLLLATTLPAGIPAPLLALTTLTEGFDRQSRILILGGAVLGFIAFKALVQALNRSLIAHLDGRLGRDVRNALCARTLALDYPFFLRNDKARLVQIISTDCWYTAQMMRHAMGIIPATSALFVFGLILLYINWSLTLIAVICAALIQAVLIAFERRQRRFSDGLTSSNQALSERMLAVIDAMRAIRIFGQQQREFEQFAKASERVRVSGERIERTSALTLPAVDVLVAAAFVLILLAGIWLGVSLPEIIAFVVLLTRAQPYGEAISRARLQIAALNGPVSEVRWLLSQLPAPESEAGTLPVPAIDQPIRFERVSYLYPDGSYAVRDVSFSIEPAVATALIGKSGAGKTTLVNLLGRLIEPASGAIFHGAERLNALAPNEWRAHIAMAGQDIDLLDGTVAENIAYGRDNATMEEVEDVARTAGALGFIQAMPKGFDTRLGLDALNLSGGQRQRIGLARALLRRPDLLILDEAMSAVDAMGEAEIVRLLAEHRHFRTALFISHRKSALEACRNGIVIDQGRIVEHGPLDQLSYYRTMD